MSDPMRRRAAGLAVGTWVSIGSGFVTVFFLGYTLLPVWLTVMLGVLAMLVVAGLLDAIGWAIQRHEIPPLDAEGEDR